MSLGKTFLQGMSDFWLRYFADTAIIETGHEAVLEAAGASYHSMLMTLMRLSLRDTPLTELSPWELALIFDDQIVEVPTGDPAVSYWMWELPSNIRSLATIQNVALYPTSILERDADFELVVDGSPRLEELRFYAPMLPTSGWFLLFYKDPFSWTASGTSIPGFGLSAQVFDLPVRITSSEVGDWTTQGLAVGETLRFDHADGVLSFSIITAIAADYLTVDIRSPLGSLSSGSLTVGTDYPYFDDTLTSVAADVVEVPTRVRVLSGWIPNAERDFFSLHELYGYPLGAPQEPSTEAYRAFVQGLWHLYIRGPVLTYIESALGVVNGYPVIRTDGPLVTSITTPEVGSISVVTSLYEPEEGILVAVPGTEIEYLLPNGTPLTASIVFSAREYRGVARDGSVTVFTDTTWLADAAEPDSFAILGALEGTSTLYIGTTDTTYDIKFIYRSAIEIFAADALAELVDGLAWEIRHDFGEGDATLAAGSAGQFLANSPTDTPLAAFDPLADVFRVTDYLETPDWWHSTVIPPGLIATLDSDRRVALPDLYACTVGSGEYRGESGDLGLYVGGDSDGLTDKTLGTSVLHDGHHLLDFVEAGVAVGDSVIVFLPATLAEENGVATCTAYEAGSVTRTIGAVSPYSLTLEDDPAEYFDDDAFKYEGAFLDVNAAKYEITDKIEARTTGELRFGLESRRTVAYLLMDKFLKWNSFGVTIDADTAAFPRGLAFTISTLLEGKPAHTYPFVSSESDIADAFPSITDGGVSIVSSGGSGEGLGVGGLGEGGLGE